jgi:multiple sugar transport system permease protein
MKSDLLTRPRAAEVASEPALRRDTQRAHRRRRLGSKLALYGLLAVLAVPFLYPTVWMVFAAFKPADEFFSTPPRLLPQDWTLDGIAKIFTVTPFAQQYVNSLYLATVIAIGSIAVGALGGYAFARIRFPCAGPLFLVLMSGMMIPGEVTIIPIFRWVAELGLMDSHVPLIVVPIFGPGCVVSVFIFRQFFLSLPRELEEAGRLDGLGRFGLFARIALPLSGPAIAAVAIMKFLFAFNMYFEPLVFLRSPELFPVGLGLTQYQDSYGDPLYNTQVGATALTVIPVLVVFLFAQRQFVEGLTRSGLKG